MVHALHRASAFMSRRNTHDEHPNWIATPSNARGMQTLLNMLGRHPAREAAEILLENTLPVIICTGFPVAGRPETDGPPGAIALADALLYLRRPVSIATYPLLLDILRKIRPRYQTIAVPTGSRATRRV